MLLSQQNDYLLEKLGEIFAFEMCVGFNGKVWIKSERPVDTIMIFNSIQRIVDLHMQGEETKSEVDSIIKSLTKKKKWF